MILQVTIRDIPAIENLTVETMHASVEASEAEKQAFLNNIARNLAWWCSHQHAAVHLMYLQDGRPAGAILVKEYWNLCSLFVQPGWQGRGIGRALLEAAIQQCRGRSPKSALHVNAAANAVGFYARHGFEVGDAAGQVLLGATPMALVLTAEA